MCEFVCVWLRERKKHTGVEGEELVKPSLLKLFVLGGLELDLMGDSLTHNLMRTPATYQSQQAQTASINYWRRMVPLFFQRHNDTKALAF